MKKKEEEEKFNSAFQLFSNEMGASSFLPFTLPIVWYKLLLLYDTCLFVAESLEHFRNRDCESRRRMNCQRNFQSLQISALWQLTHWDMTGMLSRTVLMYRYMYI